MHGTVIGFEDSNRFAMGSAGVLEKVLESYPDIPTRHNDAGEPELDGTAFFIDSQQGRPTLSVLLSWDTPKPSLFPVRAGVAFACDNRFIDFHWLSSTRSP
ncbi:hypothetical protein Pa4123_66220 [Phytohabitans aurantiacus]|uniref:Uncharacterized protein n=1 Tax=Phytohabitans aurantiacus TaxID=3016789 RepID=A0ABQ5R474_9ACTN|nr:hypothetical protein Pa4123_66220 [Phytohabitans aurantiacus]